MQRNNIRFSRKTVVGYILYSIFLIVKRKHQGALSVGLCDWSIPAALAVGLLAENCVIGWIVQSLMHINKLYKP